MNTKPSYNNRLQEAKSLLDKKLYDEALAIYETLRKEDPKDVRPIAGAGACLFAMEERTQALGCFVKASELQPEKAEHFVNMGHCLRASGKDSLAILQFGKALTLDPNNFQALSELGQIYLDRNRHTEAIDVLKKAISIKPSDSRNNSHLALALAIDGNCEEAVKHANKAIRLQPNNEYFYLTRGVISIISGNLDEADNFLKKAIEINPHNGNAYQAIVSKKITEKDRPFIEKMEKVLKQGMSSHNRKLILNAIGKSYNDLKNYERAFECIREANELSIPDYDPKSHSKKLRMLRHFFSKKFFHQKQIHPTTKHTPIFIIGMPRSGSTLLDQILSAHSSVFSGGESSALGDTIDEIMDDKNNNIANPACLNELTQSEIEKYGNVYTQKIAYNAKNVTHIVDKNLFNHEFAGYIALLFPNAKIIHAKRHPLDTALSCYMTSFSAGLDWTNDLQYIGKYYRAYVELMDYWHKTLPIPILDMQYEDVVENPENQVRHLLQFCDLEWEEQCLDFYKSKRSVNTASIWQVRQPVYKSSVQRWVPYAKHLQPLILELGDLLEADYDKIESLGLKHGPRHNNPINKISKLFR